MAGTIAGGRLAAKTNKQKYGSDFYAKIGTLGGKARVPKGFGINHELAREAGRIGGRKSKRQKRLIGYSEGIPQYQRTV